MKTRRLKIRNQTWKIVLGRPPQNKCSALCVYETRTIYIRPKPDKLEVASDAVHEMLHALFPDLEEYVICEATNVIMKGLEIVA